MRVKVIECVVIADTIYEQAKLAIFNAIVKWTVITSITFKPLRIAVGILQGRINGTERSKSMSDYIKREDALTAIAGLLNVIEQVDGADVVEVRHGYWKDGDEPIIPYEGDYDGYCSVCGKWSEYLTDFCPNCGARMDGGESDE